MIDSDLKNLRDIYTRYTTDELIKLILLKSDDYKPETITIIREEFQKREGNIKKFIEKEILKSGINEYAITDTLYISTQKGEVIGNLHFTSNGVYFIPVKCKSEIFPYGAFLYTFGTIGFVFDELAKHVSEKFPKKLPNVEMNKMIKSKQLPLSLITNYIDYSFGEDIDKIKLISYWESGDINLQTLDGKTFSFRIDKIKIPLLNTWIVSHKISFNRRKGLFEEIFGKLKSFRKEKE